MRTAITWPIAGLLGVFWAAAAPAAMLDISAVYSPNKQNPSHNSFVNTTPISGYCVRYPGQCAANNQFSIDVPINFETQVGIDPVSNQNDPRQGAYFQLPSSFRSITMYHETTGEAAELKFRVSGFGFKYRLAASQSGSHASLWNSTWVYAPAPCLYSGVGEFSSSVYGFFWKTPVGAGACKKTARVQIQPPFRYTDFGIAYELVTPNPMSMGLGRYTGSVTFTVGPGRDLDLGDLMLPSDNTLTFNFNLAVNHLLKVDFPPGSERAILQPAKGWQEWLSGGRLPWAISATQRFKLSSSGKFRMHLECQYAAGDTCGIRNADPNPPVAVYITVTLPPGIVQSGNQRPVQNRRLYFGSTNAVEFHTQEVQFERGASLDYLVTNNGLLQMAAHAGQTYRGVATVVFDASF